jgi:hypothetical protein
MDLNARPVRQEKFQSEILDKEMVLYFPGGGQFLYLNQTAAFVWEHCDGLTSAGDIIRSIQTVFPESAEEIQEDVEETLQTFLKHSCIALI